jgi:hypothetical protein
MTTLCVYFDMVIYMSDLSIIVYLILDYRYRPVDAFFTKEEAEEYIRSRISSRLSVMEMTVRHY